MNFGVKCYEGDIYMWEFETGVIWYVNSCHQIEADILKHIVGEMFFLNLQSCKRWQVKLGFR